MPNTHKKPTTWFVRQGGNVYGPFDSARLKKLADAQKISPASEVTKQLPGPWAQASLVKGLFTPPTSSELKVPAVDFPAVRVGSGRWYYREIGKDDDEASGPHSTEEMDQLIARGVVRASTLVIQEGESQWETAFSSGLYLEEACSVKEVAASLYELNGTASATTPPSSPSSPAKDVETETVLWTGKPTHHAQYGTYVLCALAAPLVLPAIWGIKKFAERDSTRYLITSRRVRIKSGARDKKKRIDIPLRAISDARMVSPSFLEQTDACDIELWGESSMQPLATLEGLPLKQSALIISLCEAALHRHIPTQKAARLAADTSAQEAESRRRAEERHRIEQDALRRQARDAERRARQAERKLDAMRKDLSGLAMETAMRLASEKSWTPPPIERRKVKPVSKFTIWWYGTAKRPRVVRVEGHYRGKTWVRPHDRHLD